MPAPFVTSEGLAEPLVSQDTREIALSNGFVTLVDAADFEWLSQWHWQVSTPNARGYAGRFERFGPARKGGRKRRFVLMHRLLIGACPGQFVDHANHLRLDNRRRNLRLCTLSQNQANSLRTPGASGYRGVQAPDPAKSMYGFRAIIGLDRKLTRLGTFATAEEAARVYDAEAVRRFGEFAVLNFPDRVAA